MVNCLTLVRLKKQKWYVMGRRKVDKELDEMSRYLLSKGTFSLKDSGNAADRMILKALKRSEARIYRFWLGVFYAFALMLSLYWLPLFGPMIAGYIGGKRTGSPTRGVIAGLIVAGIFYIMSAPDMLAYIPVNIMAMRDNLVSASVAQFPWMSPMMSFVVSYTTPTVTLLSGKIGYTPQTYSILLVFAYIGGTMAKQRREEIRLLALSRIASGLTLQAMLEPMPHHSARAISRASGRGFEEYSHADPESRRIYRAEFGYDDARRTRRPRKTRETAGARSSRSSGKSRKSMKKEELIKGASHHRTSRYGFL